MNAVQWIVAALPAAFLIFAVTGEIVVTRRDRRLRRELEEHDRHRRAPFRPGYGP